MGLCFSRKVKPKASQSMESRSLLLIRPLTISDADCDIDHPDPNDQQYTLFFYMVKLSCILGDVLRAFCSPRARLMSEKGIVLENISRSLEQMLLGWRRSLPSHLALSKTDLYMISQKDIDAEFRAKLSNGGKYIICSSIHAVCNM